eukprot:COSAG06_NODE_50193_length_320_cov_0.927602_1_plen_58_part_10
MSRNTVFYVDAALAAGAGVCMLLSATLNTATKAGVSSSMPWGGTMYLDAAWLIMIVRD